MTDIARTSKPQPPGAGTNAAGGSLTGDSDPIAIGLQRLFEAMADEPVPDEFMALLDRMEAAEREREADATQIPPTAGGRASR